MTRSVGAETGRLRRIVRSFSFRFVLIYAALFTVSVGALFLIAAVTTNRFMTAQLDAAVSDEIAEIRADAGSLETARLVPVIAQLAERSPGFFYLLQDPGGAVLAGNMTALRAVPGRRELQRDHPRSRTATDGPVRGDGLRLADGSFLFVGTSSFALHEVHESIARAFLWSLGLIAVLAFLGGGVMSLLVLRRIETVNRTSRAIMAGDLSRRIPVAGSNDEFDHLSDSLNAMLDRIEALMTGMQQISNDIAHDLRTPLSRLRQRLELARLKEHSVEGLHRQLDHAIDHVDDTLVTFNALLRIAQIEARAPRENFEALDLAPLLTDLVEIYGPAAEESGYALTLVLDGPLPVRGDRSLLGQLFSNLIENALKHTPPGSRIAIDGRADAPGVRVRIADTGPGVPADRLDDVFRRFVRLDPSRGSGGSGLGLSLVKAIADLHEAEIALLDNKPGLACVLLFARTTTPPA